MILPAKPPTARGLATSGLLIEAGLALAVTGLLVSGWWLPIGSLLIAGGLVSFVRKVRLVVAERLPRPPALPARDWSAWQVHAAFLWLAVATTLGLLLTILPAGSTQVTVAWVYGVAGLVGGLSQVVVGMQGRLVPMYAYYRAMAARDGKPPERSAHSLVSPSFAKAIFIAWACGVPWLAWGLAVQHTASVRAASLVLTAGVFVSAAYLHRVVRSAHEGQPQRRSPI